jgi:type I restriction enzyme S subunit
MNGESPRGWAVAQLDDVVEVLDRLRRPVNSEEREQRPGAIPYYGATGQVGWIDSHLFDEELVLLGEDGAPFLEPTKAKAYIIAGKSWVNNHAHVLRASRGIDSRLLMHQLNVVDYHPYVSGTTRLKLPQGSMNQIPLRIPPLAEQRRIVAAIEEHLSRLDAAVAGLERVQAMILRYRAAVLKAAVEGRLVATEASLAQKRGNEYESADALIERIGRQDARRAHPELERVQLRHPPEGWTWTSLGSIGALQSGIQKQPSRRPVKNRFPFLRVANVGRGRLDLSEIHEVELFNGELERLRLQKGDLLVVEGNGSATEIGRLAVWNGQIEDCVHQNHLIRHRPYPGILPEYVAAYWNSPEGAKRVLNVASSTSGLYTLSVGKISRLPVPIPPTAEQTRIVEELDRRFTLLATLGSEIASKLARAARLRQSILQRAFEGKLVPQDTNDEPASVLLERIRAARATPPSRNKTRRRSIAGSERG